MSSETQKILTTDGIPLEVSLKKVERRNKFKAFLLVSPLLFFLLIVYISPIVGMLFNSVDDRMVTNMLPKTFSSMETWDGKELPSEEVFKSFYQDFKILVDKDEHGKLATQLNYEKNGFKSILKKYGRKLNNFEEGNYKEQTVDIHERWGNVDYWRAIQRRATAYSYSKYLKGLDMYQNEDGKIVQVEEDRRIYKKLWVRTLKIAFYVTLLCFLMAYYGPNSTLLCGIDGADVAKNIKITASLFSVDLFSGILSAILLWKMCRINLFKVYLRFNKSFLYYL